MTARGEQLTEQLRDAAKCPNCQYSLRGLPGDDVQCPECGTKVNIAALVSATWMRPWWEAPLYNTLAWPLAWVIFAFIGVLVVGGASLRSPFAAEIVLAASAGGIVVWLFLLAYMQHRFGSPEGIWLALLLHVVVPFYMFGMVGAIGMTIKLIGEIRELWIVTLYNAIGLSLFVGMFLGGRMIERFVGRRCIRRHLRLMIESSSTSAHLPSQTIRD
jgi:hypothetical protein